MVVRALMLPHTNANPTTDARPQAHARRNFPITSDRDPHTFLRLKLSWRDTGSCRYQGDKRSKSLAWTILSAIEIIASYAGPGQNRIHIDKSSP